MDEVYVDLQHRGVESRRHGSERLLDRTSEENEVDRISVGGHSANVAE